MTQLQKPKLLLILALALGWLTDWLFYGKALGVSLLIFVIALLGVLAMATIWEERPWRWRNLWLMGPLLFFAAMVMVRDNSFVTFLNVGATLFLLALLAYFYTADSLTRPGLVEFSILPMRVLGGMVARPWSHVQTQFNFTAVREKSSYRVAPLVRGVVLAAPILFVFGLLLASADVIFASTIRRALLFDWGFYPLESVWRGFLIVTVGWLLGGGVMYALRQDTAVKASVPEKLMLALAERLPFGFIESATILTLINGLFAAFVTIQFVYLFGGADNIAFEGLTYSEYARRGFFELVMVAVLSLGLILVLNWFTGRRNGHQMMTFNLLCSLMIGFVLVMLVSAFKRMALYEYIYGFTELRLYVYVFMGWLAAVLAWFVGTLWLKPDRFAVGVLVAALGFVATLNIINPDAFIVRQNMVRYEILGYLDMTYLSTLSADAVPELIKVARAVADDETITAVDCHTDYSGRMINSGYSCLEATEPNYLQTHLEERLTALVGNQALWSWQAWHYGRYQAYQLLQQEP